MWRARAILSVVLATLVLVVSGVAVASATHAFDRTQDHGSGPTYNVTFTETGLPAGTNWSVRVVSVWGLWGWHQVETNSSTGTSLNFSLPNGTYHYRAEPLVGFQSNDSRGFFNVSGGSPTPIGVSFTSVPTYSVTFTETGLAAGTNWTVTVQGRGWWGGWEGRSVDSITSSAASVTFLLPDGTYHYRVAPVFDYSLNGSHGRFTVAGATLPAINVTFSALVTYAVTFNESGLPAGTNWSVHVLGFGPTSAGFLRDTETSSGTTVTLNLPNGTYFYNVLRVPGWRVTSGDRFGLFNVSGGSPAEISFVFTQVNNSTHWSPLSTELGTNSGTDIARVLLVPEARVA
ncbi:MAG: hypothetical protein ACLP74_06635 [Thermoplasmata archaeon]